MIEFNAPILFFLLGFIRVKQKVVEKIVQKSKEKFGFS